MKLKGNTVLVTGGGSGIGFELAKRLVDLGNTVIITGRNMAKLEKAKQLIPGVHVYQVDVADPNSIAQLYEQVIKAFPALNMLVNNAGIMLTLNLQDKNLEKTDMTSEIDINLKGPMRMVQKFLPHLKTKSESAIMNVSSGLAFVPLASSPVYCATKAGLHSYTQSLRVQLKETNVKVFELAPPATKTELLGDFEPKGITIMSVEKMVETAIQGLQNDQFEICPGQSSQLRMMSRLAPKFILGQMSNTQLKLGQMVQSYRQKAGLTQMELAKRLGYSTPQFVSIMERGEGKIPLSTVGSLIKILRLPEGEIFDILLDTYKNQIKKEIRAGKKALA